MVKLSKEDIARALYDLNERLNQLDKKVDAITNKFTVSLDVLEKKVKELEGLIAVLDEDYYNIKTETLKTLKSFEPLADDLKDYPYFKEKLLHEITVLSESMEKMSEILKDHHKRLKKLENLYKVMIKEL
ncbi:MAG: hypothetical protein GXN99_01545 [Candidatus Nanohaloarchaeota archaeon]|nr:hypothetical protein [Candidatus Nanohaloarchaeota archaeon]